MRFVETLELTDTDPKKYTGPPKVDRKTGKPLCKNGQEPDEEGNCLNDKDMHSDKPLPDDEIANKHKQEDRHTMKKLQESSEALRQELLTLGIKLPEKKEDSSISEPTNPIREALNIMRNSPNTIEMKTRTKEIVTTLSEEAKAKYKHSNEPLDPEKAKTSGEAAAARAKATIDGQKKKKPIIW